MLRFAWLALVAGSFMAITARAQTPPATPQGYGFCTVTDSSSVQVKIWASPVFPLTDLPKSDPAGFQRSQELAAEFLTHVGTLGGSGVKSCVILPTQGEVATFREEQRAIWDKRLYFVKLGDWREVAWAPAARSTATVAAPPAELTRYFHCSATQVDIPDRSDRARTVATTVFARKVSGGNPMAPYEAAAAYTRQFKQQVQAHGLPELGDCAPFDTQAEAENQRRQTIKNFKGFNMKFYEIAWTPTENGTAIVTAPPSKQAAAALPAATAATTVVSAVSPGKGQYCTAFVTRTKVNLSLHLPIREFPFPQSDHAAMRSALSGVIAAVIAARRVKWMAFAPVTCHDNSGVFAGETYCVSVTYKHFGGTQVAAQFCNGSKEMIDKRWADMVKADGGNAREFPWP